MSKAVFLTEEEQVPPLEIPKRQKPEKQKDDWDDDPDLTRQVMEKTEIEEVTEREYVDESVPPLQFPWQRECSDCN